MGRHKFTPEERERGQASLDRRGARHRFTRAQTRKGGKAGPAAHDERGTRVQFTDEERKRGGRTTAAKGPEYMRALARKGGEATARKRKQKQEAGRKGGLARWRRKTT